MTRGEQEPVVIACAQCGTENPDGARFCFACGTPPARSCPSCSAPLPVPDARFCPSCGQKVAGTEEDLMLKLVSVLFADVVSSTERAEKMFPDEVRDLMKEFFDAMTEEIHAEGGRIDKFIGDSVMALFGVPVAREDDALRAVRAARRMIARTELFNDGREPLHQVRIRVGINTGEVLAAADDVQFRVTGDTVNVASRLESNAPVMRVLIGERTARAVRPHFELESIGPLTLKGKSEPVPAYLVTGEKELHEERAASTVLHAPLIGREHELAALRGALGDVRKRGTAGMTTVVAEAGVGKSRLLREFLATVGRGVAAVSGRCLPYGDGVTLWPFNEILMGESGILLTDRSEMVRDKVAKLVEKVAPEVQAEQIVTGLVATVGVADVAEQGVDPREMFKEIVAAWDVLFTALARSGPLVVLVEDLHWADASMLGILRLLLDRIRAPVLFVCTARPALFVSSPEWSGVGTTAPVHLEPLSQGHSRILVDHLLGNSDVSAAMREEILARTEGNPFFVEEVLQRLIDEGCLVREADGWRKSGDFDRIEIPENVQGVILARIDLLPAAERRLLQSAAVVGRVFWAGSLVNLGGGGDPAAALADLERRGLVYRSSSSSIAGEAEYSFKHVLIRDVAYETLPRKKRARTHIEVAGWIEERSGERAVDLSELLAHHYHLAFGYSRDDRHRREARRRWAEAAQNATKRFAIEQGLRFARSAVELSRTPLERAESLEELGDICFLVLDVDGAWTSYNEAIAEPDIGDLRTRVAAKASLAATRWEKTMRETPDAKVLRSMIDGGLRDAAGREERTHAMLLVASAFLQISGYEEIDASGRDAAEEAVAIAERSGDADLLSAALDAATYWLMPEGLHGQIARLNRRRVELVPRLRDVREICDAHMVAAWSSLFAGRYRDGERAATACVDSARGIDPGGYVLGLAERVQARAWTGDWDGALADQAEIERIEGETGQDLPGPHVWKAYAFALWCHELRGDEDAVEAYLEMLKRFDDEVSVTVREGPTVRAATQARALVHRGRFEEAMPLIRVRPGPVLCSQLEALSDLVLATGDWERAAGTVEAARREAERAHLAGLRTFADRLEGAAAAAEGELGRGTRLLETAAHAFARLGAPWEAAWTRLLLGETLATAGDEATARAELSGALEVFERLGAPGEALRARGALSRAAP